MNTARRAVLKSATASSVLGGLIVAGALRPMHVLSADWNKAAFDAHETAEALRGIGAGTPIASKDVVLKVPDIAENGAMVQVDVVSSIPNTTSMAILIERNPFPLSASFDFYNGALPEVSVRLKMAQTSLVKVVARADGKFYTAQKEVKVTVGGCGG